MDNLWFLTEERPKPSVILQIIEMYCKDFNDTYEKDSEVKIKPHIENGIFKFLYEVEGLKLKNTEKIYIMTVSGSSSFLDFLLFRQENAPQEGCQSDNLIMAIEETKTSDDESRNTGISQRVSKFVYFRKFYKSVRMYMLYNEELEGRPDKKPSDTNIFGTNILLALGITIVGKNTDKWFKPFTSLDELIDFKANMKKPPKGNIPIEITKKGSVIEVSGRLDKPSGRGNIAHDPSMGGLSMIGAGIRQLGWKGDIVITRHGVSQKYIDKNTKNKFLFNCHLLSMKLLGLKMPEIKIPNEYWHYEKSSEKMTSILLHVLGVYNGMYGVYENHAGCERGYFRDKQNRLITLPKKDKNGENLFLPDVVLYDEITQFVLLVEGKKLSTLVNGIEEIENYDSIEHDYIDKYYPNTSVLRCVSVFGGNKQGYLHPAVLIYMNNNGEIFINPSAPTCVKRMFEKHGVKI